VEDDTYRGWRIPKGSVILANVWYVILLYTNNDHLVYTLSLDRKMMHDEKIYTNPYTFNPDRFLGPSPDKDPADFVFGYGRR